VFQNGIFSGSYWGTGAGNTWTFQAGVNTLPVYDSACGALEIIPDVTTALLDNTGAVAPFSELNLPANSCNVYGMWCEGDATQTVWAYFIAEENVAYEISTCNPGTNFDTQIALWHGVDCGDFWNFELISANDDVLGGCGEGTGYASLCYASCLVPGDVYYIMLDGFYGATGTAVISVDTYNGDLTLSTEVNPMNCPLSEGQSPSGSIFPSIMGTGSDFACQWTGPGGYTSNDHFILNLGAGVYSLVATTACGDVFLGQYTITQPNAWNVDIDATSATCPQSQNGVISVAASGASPGYTYNYSGPGNYSGSGEQVSDVTMGGYLVTVTDSHGCIYADSVYIQAIDDLEFSLGNDTIICMGDQLVVPGPPGLNYLWQDGSTNPSYQIITEDWGLGTAALVLTGYTDDGCTHTAAYVFEIETCIGINEAIATELNLYPNPNSGSFFFINYNFSSLQVMDATGRMVMETTNLDTGRINLDTHLTEGLYWVKFSRDDSTVVVPMIVVE